MDRKFWKGTNCTISRAATLPVKDKKILSYLEEENAYYARYATFLFPFRSFLEQLDRHFGSTVTTKKGLLFVMFPENVEGMSEYIISFPSGSFFLVLDR